MTQLTLIDHSLFQEINFKLVPEGENPLYTSVISPSPYTSMSKLEAFKRFSVQAYQRGFSEIEKDNEKKKKEEEELAKILRREKAEQIYR